MSINERTTQTMASGVVVKIYLAEHRYTMLSSDYRNALPIPNYLEIVVPLSSLQYTPWTKRDQSWLKLKYDHTNDCKKVTFKNISHEIVYTYQVN